MKIIEAISLFINYGVAALIIFVIVLMLVRLLLGWMDVNPFTGPVITVRKLSDPLISPVRRALMGFGFQASLAPLIVILIVILLGWFAIQLTGSVLMTAAGVLKSLQLRSFISLIGYVLYGALSIYELLIFIRIIFSWGQVSYANRLMRFLVQVTDPLLLPLRRIIPPLGMMDISPIVAFILIWLFKAAVAGTLIRV